MMNIQPELYS